MILRFVPPEDPAWPLYVEYGPGGNHHVPRVGEGVVSDGSDPDFKPGIYEATHVTNHVSLRGGLTLVVVDLRRVADLPIASERRS